MIFRVYSIVYLLLYLYLTANSAYLTTSGVWEWIDIAIMVTAITGMMSYAFFFRVLFRKFWEYFFYIFIIYEFVYMSWLQIPFIMKMGLMEQRMLTNLINVGLMIPLAWSIHNLQKQWENALFFIGRKKG